MNIRRLREYMILCDYFDIEPTWRGLRSFQASFDIRRNCDINRRKREAGGCSDVGC